MICRAGAWDARRPRRSRDGLGAVDTRRFGVVIAAVHIKYRCGGKGNDDDYAGIGKAGSVGRPFHSDPPVLQESLNIIHQFFELNADKKAWDWISSSRFVRPTPNDAMA